MGMRVKKQRGKDEAYKIIEECIKKEHLKISPEFVLNFLKYKYWKRIGHKGGTKELCYVTRQLNAQFCSGAHIKTLRPLITPPRKKDRSDEKSKGRKPKKTKNNKWIPYDEQLQDPKWLEFREKVFRARGRRCEHCGSLEHLQVHHPKYIDGHKAWEYTTSQVVVLCRDCHKKEHNITEEDSSDK